MKYYTLQMLYMTHNLVRGAVNRGLTLLKLPSLEYYESTARIKFIKLMFVGAKHFLTSLLIWFPVTLEDQKALMLYLILPTNGGLLGSLPSIFNPNGLDLIHLSDSLKFLGNSVSMPISAGHTAIDLTNENWTNALKETYLKLNLEEQKKLIEFITRPLIVNPIELVTSLPDPLHLKEISMKPPMDLITALDPRNIIKETQLALHLPNGIPIHLPSEVPAHLPNNIPTHLPTEVPTHLPTGIPTHLPIEVPNQLPIEVPTHLPAGIPNHLPISIPLNIPAHLPISIPFDIPTHLPISIPLDIPTHLPIEVPTHLPIDVPVHLPLGIPTEKPISIPIDTPSEKPINPTIPSLPTLPHLPLPSIPGLPFPKVPLPTIPNIPFPKVSLPTPSKIPTFFPY